MFRNALGALALAAFASVVCACGTTPSGAGATPASLPTPTPVGLQTPAAGAYLGAYVGPANGTIKTIEQLMGRTAAMNMHYYPWAGLFPHFFEPADLANGRFSVDSWDCGMSDAQIASGAADGLITTRATAIKAFGHALFLRWFWDMNLPSTQVLPYSLQPRTACYDPATDNPDGTFSAKEFVAAWIHVRQIFAQQGVTNVVWVWNISASGVDPTAYYPGDSQVDWVGVDTYDDANTDFTTLFAPTYKLVSSHNKPILIGETGTIASNQQSFLEGVPAALQSTFPLVKGFMYFDGANDGVNYGLSQSGGMTGFAVMSRDPYMQPLGSP